MQGHSPLASALGLTHLPRLYWPILIFTLFGFVVLTSALNFDYDAALHMAGTNSRTCLPSTMGLSSRESSPFSIPTSRKLGLQLACSWQRSIAIQTAHSWAALRVSSQATDLSKKQMPIYGKRCSSYLRGAIKQGTTNWSLGNR